MTSFAAESHPGKKRSHNEDSFLSNPELGLWLVADGVGGHADGEVASAIVSRTIEQDLSKGESLGNSILHSHQAVLREISQREKSNMGSTVVALKLDGADYEICWVGDSRAYLYDGDLRQITRDHNPVSEMLARGLLTPEQASNHPERNVLSQSLGVSTAVKVSPGRIQDSLQPGDQLLLCSDGLTDELNDESIQTILKANETPQQQVNALIAAALAAGGRDNVTVVIVNHDGTAQQHSNGHQAHVTREIEAPQSTDTHKRSHDTKALVVLGVISLLIIAWFLASLS